MSHEWYVEIVPYGVENVEADPGFRRMGPMSEHLADKTDRGANINLDHNRYYTRIVRASQITARSREGRGGMSEEVIVSCRPPCRWRGPQSSLVHYLGLRLCPECNAEFKAWPNRTSGEQPPPVAVKTHM